MTQNSASCSGQGTPASQISEVHRREWVERSGVAPDIVTLNVQSVSDPYEVDRLLNRNNNRRWKHWEHGPGWWVSGVDPATGEPIFDGGQFKPDSPRQKVNDDGSPKCKADGSPDYQKYECPVGQKAQPLFLAMPQADYWPKLLEQPRGLVVITEGAKKAGALLSVGIPAISVSGVSNGQLKGRLNERLKLFAKERWTVVLAFDADVLVKPGVCRALDKLAKLIDAAGALVKIVDWSDGLEDCKGVDDYKVAYGDQALTDLIDEAITIEEWREQRKERPALPPVIQKRESPYQVAFQALYSTEPWICFDGLLHQWAGSHYEKVEDGAELRRITSWCDEYSEVKEDQWGNLVSENPFARPAMPESILKWAKMRLYVSPGRVNQQGLNTLGGVIDIQWRGSMPVDWTLTAHDSQKHLFTYCAEWSPDRAADPSHCGRMLQALGEEYQAIFLRTIAASLDLPRVRKYRGRAVRALLAKGDGNNGKDTLREAVLQMYGAVGVTSCSLTDFAQYDQGRKFPLASLRGSRVNWPSENTSFVHLDGIQSLKCGVTGDPLSWERKNQDEQTFNPSAVFIFNINLAPDIRASQEAIKSRYGVLPFDKTFKPNPKTEMGELPADPRFKDDPQFLKVQVVPALFNLVFAALRDLMAEGIDYTPTLAALEEVQRAGSHLFQFAHEVGLAEDPTGRVALRHLWSRLEAWYQTVGALTVETADNGKEKRIWSDFSDRDKVVKGSNQVIRRFKSIFSKVRQGRDKEDTYLIGISFPAENSAITSKTGSSSPPPLPEPISAPPTSPPDLHLLRNVSISETSEPEAPASEVETKVYKWSSDGDVGGAENQSYQGDGDDDPVLPKTIELPKTDDFSVGDQVWVWHDHKIVGGPMLGEITRTLEVHRVCEHSSSLVDYFKVKLAGGSRLEVCCHGVHRTRAELIAARTEG